MSINDANQYYDRDLEQFATELEGCPCDRARSMEPDVRKRQIMIWYTILAIIGVLLFQ